METRKEQKTTQNKGVNITSDSFLELEENDMDVNNAADFPSLRNVRSQLQNVIDVMGTSTPHIIYATNSVDADNEDSIISSTSIFSSVVQVKHMGLNKEQMSSTYNSPRDFSEATTAPNPDICMVHNRCQEQSAQPIYVPAVLPPAILCMNPNCVCAHSHPYVQQIPININHGSPNEQCLKRNKKRKFKLPNFLGKLSKMRGEFKSSNLIQTDLYRINIPQTPREGTLPKRFIFDLIDGIPKTNVNTVGTNTKSKRKKVPCTGTPNTFVCDGRRENSKFMSSAYYKTLEENSKLNYKTNKDSTKVDVYYFDHGNAAYFRTTDCPPIIHTEAMAEKTEVYATKFWAELFGTIYIAFAFITSFILQLFRFFLHSIIRPLTIGTLQLVSDYFFKPFLAVIFNAIIQPPLIFFYNIATSLRDLCDPIAESIGYFLREIAVLCKTIRLFDIRYNKQAKTEDTDGRNENKNEFKKCSCS